MHGTDGKRTGLLVTPRIKHRIHIQTTTQMHIHISPKRSIQSRVLYLQVCSYLPKCNTTKVWHYVPVRFTLLKRALLGLSNNNNNNNKETNCVLMPWNTFWRSILCHIFLSNLSERVESTAKVDVLALFSLLLFSSEFFFSSASARTSITLWHLNNLKEYL